jgi:putative Ca2+/H+ antiporter (TMEM165/GDT1 family)
LEAFFVATGLVALAEIGDKTQLLSLLLVARYRQPLPIVAGIAVATLLNHALAGLLGHVLAAHLPAEALRWGIGLAFLAMALWALRADRLDGDATPADVPLFRIVAMTTLAFFLAEIGDKTQLATVALAARFHEALVAVVIGTTLGMLVANVPVVYAGRWLMAKIPLAWIRRAAAFAFALLGILVLLSTRG